MGFIDLGSNSSRLTVVEFDRRGRVTVLNRVKSMVRLGERAFETKELQPEAMDRALACLVEFAEICHSYGVTEVVAVGTAALRVAQNSIDFVNRVKERTGFDLQVISGDEEARLIRVGIWVRCLRPRIRFFLSISVAAAPRCRFPLETRSIFWSP